MATSALAIVLMLVVIGGLFIGLFILNTLSYTRRYSTPRHIKESRFGHSAHHLVAEVDEAVRHCSIPPAKRKVIKQQAREISDNINGALWKLHHLRKIRQLAAGMGGYSGGASYTAQVATEVTEMEKKLLREMDRSLEVLFSVPLSLMKVGLAQGERTADRILAELRETNQRLRDIAVSYDEMKSYSDEPITPQEYERHPGTPAEPPNTGASAGVRA